MIARFHSYYFISVSILVLWLVGVVKGAGLAISRSQVCIIGTHCQVQLWASASVNKQYNLVPANGWWCLAAGKVTVALASHWPHVPDISGSPPTGLRPRRGRWACNKALLWSMVDCTFHRQWFNVCTPCFIKKTTQFLITYNFGKHWPIFKSVYPRM